MSRLDSGLFTRAQVAAGFFTAPEYKGQIEAFARIYWASFDRAPDYGGLLFWNSVLRNGAKLDDIATVFSYSTEFAQRYGANTSNQDFVKVMYNNALGRAPDPQGEAYWVAALSAGMSRGQLLNHFSQSSELRGKLSSKTLGVAAYVTMSERVPTDAELQNLPTNPESILLKAAGSAGSVLTWSQTVLQESATNDGAVPGGITIKLSGDAFKGGAGAKLGAVANVPKGLTANLVKVNDSEAKLSFTGKASPHDSANDVSNLTVTFSDADFVSGKAPPEASMSTLSIDFIDMLLYAAQGTLRGEVRPTATLTIDLVANTAKIGTTALTPIGDAMSTVARVDLSAIPESTATTTTTTTTKASATTTATQLIVFKGGPENNQYLASPLGDSVTGGGGDDTITLGAGKDIVVLPALPDGLVTINGFTAGQAGDALRLSPFLLTTKTANLTVVDTNIPIPATPAPKTWANGDVLLVTAVSSYGSTDVATLFGAASYFEAPTSTRKAVVLTSDITGDTKVWFVTNGSGAGVGAIDASEVVHAATLVGVNNFELFGFVPTNFL